MLLRSVMLAATCIPTSLGKRRPLPGDVFVPDPVFVSTHAITIDAPPERVWPWIAQLGRRSSWLVQLGCALGTDQIDVIGESAGATSALQLALRHPERVTHLAVLVGNLPGNPTAIVQPYWTKQASQRAAERIPGARFVGLESGGHLMLGHTKLIRDELADFFAERKGRRAEPVAS